MLVKWLWSWVEVMLWLKLEVAWLIRVYFSYKKNLKNQFEAFLVVSANKYWGGMLIFRHCVLYKKRLYVYKGKIESSELLNELILRNLDLLQLTSWLISKNICKNVHLALFCGIQKSINQTMSFKNTFKQMFKFMFKETL